MKNDKAKVTFLPSLYFIMLLPLTLNSNEQRLKEEKTHINYIKPVPFTDVQIEDIFWSPKIKMNRSVTIPLAFRMCEQSGHISRFTNDPNGTKSKYNWRYARDSDVYKILQAASYCLQVDKNTSLRSYVEDLIDKIKLAQWKDGYLYTFYSIPEKQPEKRWTNIGSMHELYCAGHMYEAAVAHYQATGSTKFLDIAKKNAELVHSIFAPGKRTDPPGHQEIEIALCKLYRITGETKYLDQAKFFLDQRGRLGNRGPDGKGKLYGIYSQDYKPVTEQTKSVGHAVRALYMYTAMADVAALTSDALYINALDKIWNDTVSTKLYLTGGLGAVGSHEGFGSDYELPNKTAYCETCASVANAMWNHRMFLLHGDSKYIDVLERVLYNGILSGVSLSGDRFFYSNRLESEGNHERSEWFRVACCPSNITRFLPSIPGYFYAHKDNDIYINLFAAGTATIDTGNNRVNITQQTDYPWEGKIKFIFKPERSNKFSIYIRIPGWARNQPVPTDLYCYNRATDEKISLMVNNKKIKSDIKKGYALINRKWQNGDFIDLLLPMPIRSVISHPKVIENKGKIAIERGPIVYCAEGIDNDDSIGNLKVSGNMRFNSFYESETLNGVAVLKSLDPNIILVPYYTWANRGKSPMKIWHLGE